MLIYYLCGYVLEKAEKAISCRECQETLTGNPENLECRPPESLLTEIMSFKEGSLRHQAPPNYKFFSLAWVLKHDEGRALDDSPVIGDLFWHVLEKLEASPLPSLGCATHQQEVAASVVKSYILMRMHFFC
ncbi:unnamed protein product [Ixodes pacificus]